MLKVVQSIHQDKLMGIINDDTNTIVVPVRYANVQVQRNGAVARYSGSQSPCDVYLLTGELLLENCKNALFINDDLLLFANQNNEVYIYHYPSSSYLVNIPFEAILVFIGNNPTAVPFTATTNLTSLLASPNGITQEAYLKNLVCGTYKKKWGVINIENGTIYSKFLYKIMVHNLIQGIGATDFNGNRVIL